MASRSYTFPSKIGRGQATQETHEGASPAYMAQVLGIKRVYSTIPVSFQSFTLQQPFLTFIARKPIRQETQGL